VLAYLAGSPSGAAAVSAPAAVLEAREIAALIPASPKARRLAVERRLDLAALAGSGPNGAVLAVDLVVPERAAPTADVSIPTTAVQPLDSTWRVMAERMTASWTSAPHFSLIRDVRASALVELRTRVTPAVQKRAGVALTYTDLVVRLVAAALRDHPRLNASWAGAGMQTARRDQYRHRGGCGRRRNRPGDSRRGSPELGELAARRGDLVARARSAACAQPILTVARSRLTNLGMYYVDAFTPILNPPQAAILALGRIADRVVPENGQAVVRPMVTLTLVCDHRMVDGVRAAQFLDDLAKLFEEPWGLLA